jgi:hypothetical protein
VRQRTRSARTIKRLSSPASKRVMRRRVLMVLGGMGVLAALLLAGRPLRVRWEADRTAHRLLQALHTRDSTAFASLSGSGSPRTFRCIQELWPREFWSLKGHAPNLTKIPAPPDELGYRMVGDSLPDIGAPAVVDFFIVKTRPTRVKRLFVDSRLGVWTPAVYACLKNRAA